MTVSSSPASPACARSLDDGSLRLEGHMSDDIAATFGPKPGAVLQASADELWIKGNRGDFRLPRQAIRRIGRGSLYPWLFKGVRIWHNQTGVPAKVQFLPLECDTAELLHRLHLLGYPRS